MKDVVFDIETEREFREVGGKENMHLLGVSVVGVYRYADDSLVAYEKEELPLLESVFKDARLVGFNSKHFDVPVLAPHLSFDIYALEHLDLMTGIEQSLGFRVSLDNLCRATLGKGKSAVGLDAIRWWRSGQKEKVKEYCLADVELTRDLYEFGKKHDFVFCDTRDKGRVKVPVMWREAEPACKKVLQDAFARRLSVEIEYETGESRRVDIQKLNSNSFVGFCHTRQGKRVFYFDRVMKAVLTSNSYVIENDVQRSLI